jgi:hypothetical protein
MSDDFFRCSECGDVYDYSVYQSFDDELPNWSASGGCRGCDGRVEIDGYGLPTPEFRALIFAEEGARELTIEPGADAVSTLHQLQAILNVPAGSLAPLANQVPGPVLWGTQTEMAWLASALGVRGITASVSPKDQSKDTGSVDLNEILPKGWRATGVSSPTSLT